jgi:hypothetical protein
MSTEEQIEEILWEASAYGVRIEVLESATQLIKDNPKIGKVDAYQSAYRATTFFHIGMTTYQVIHLIHQRAHHTPHLMSLYQWKRSQLNGIMEW